LSHTAAAERAKARAERQQKRAATRRAATGKDDSGADDEPESKKPISVQEQTFYVEVEEKNKKMVGAVLSVVLSHHQYHRMQLLFFGQISKARFLCRRINCWMCCLPV